jgi:hypothetical protein
MAVCSLCNGKGYQMGYELYLRSIAEEAESAIEIRMLREELEYLRKKLDAKID